MDKTELDGLLSSDAGAKTVTIDVSELAADVNSVVIPVSTIKTLATQATSDDNPLSGMDVSMTHSSVTFDAAALTAIAGQSREDTVTLCVEEVEKGTLNQTQQTALEDISASAVVVEITLRSGDERISDFQGGSADISLPYLPQTGEDTETITVWFVAQDGTLKEIPCRFEDGFVLFSVLHFSNYLIKPGTVAADASVMPKPASEPALRPDGGTDGGTVSDGSARCALCDRLGRDIAPWCWLLPVIVVLAFITALWLRLRRRRRQ